MALSVYPIYPSDLTDAEWVLLAPLIPAAKSGGRPRSVNMRRIVNGLVYLLRTGCAWRYLPQEYEPWPTIYWYFRRLSRDYERLCATSETWIYLAMIRLMVRRLVRMH
jgi:transposase